MTDCEGRIVSFEHGSASDGEGLRSVLFLYGCNMRCPFCHNPESFAGEYSTMTAGEVAARLSRYLPFLVGGGLTLSGGEPFLQENFCLEVIRRVHELGLTVIAETNGTIFSAPLIAALDGLRLDVKNYSGENGDMLVARYERVLGEAGRLRKDVLLTNVLLPGVNDTRPAVRALRTLSDAFPSCRKVKFLPFVKFCTEKYDRLGIPFPARDIPPATPADIRKAEQLYGN